MNLDPDKAKKLYIEDLYRLSFWMLSGPECTWLAAAHMLYRNPEFYIQSFYKKAEPKLGKESDWVFLQGPPAYHVDPSCEKLRADYSNFRIPVEIVSRGEEEKQRYREWFVDNQQFMEEPKKFVDKMTAHFFLRNPPHIEEIQKQNSGIAIQENTSLVDIKDRIREQLEKMKQQRTRHSSLFGKYGYKTHLVEKNELPINVEEKEILRAWHDEKNRLKTDLKVYFKLKFNPDLEFEEDLLQSIGFRPCKSCSNH